jgi:hypothetical protein
MRKVQSPEKLAQLVQLPPECSRVHWYKFAIGILEEDQIPPRFWDPGSCGSSAEQVAQVAQVLGKICLFSKNNLSKALLK